ncbi:unnamed protein product [Rotaria sp. Silwood1]|nr:unnamed protein product [Rotaria sp. Silwood1]CAF4684180.1 unnamed protein product [Rotaria sp. Silwood1]
MIEENFQPDPRNDDIVCHVTIIIDYNIQGEDYVNVTYGELVSDICDYMEFGTTFTLKDDQQSIVSYIDYICSSHHFCEYTFVNQWAKQLLGTDYNPLHTSITHLLSDSSESSKCYWNSATSDCASYMCFALYDELKDIPLSNDSCLENHSSGSIYIYVKTKLIESSQSSPIEFEYKCTHSLSCSHQTFTSIPINLRSTNFSSTLIELDQKIKSFLNNINRCDIYMEADYRQHDGHVTINYDEPKSNIHQSMSVDMIISVENSIPSIWSRMYYTCLPPHSCDRKLVHKWIRWLIDINKQTLQLESRLSLESTIQSHKCDIWSHTIDDSVDVCFAYMYKRIESMPLDNTNTIDIPSKNTNNEDRKMETYLPPFACSRFHGKKNDVYKYVLDQILKQCIPKHSLKSTQVISTSISEHPWIDQNDQSINVKSLLLHSKMKSNRIEQSTIKMSSSSSSITTTVETSTDPISS